MAVSGESNNNFPRPFFRSREFHYFSMCVCLFGHMRTCVHKYENLKITSGVIPQVLYIYLFIYLFETVSHWPIAC